MVSSGGEPIEPHLPQDAGVESQEEARGALFVIWDKKNNLFLLQKRDQNCRYYPGKWCFPGGHKKQNEQPRDAAVREVLSEYELTIPEEAFTPLVLHKQPHTDGYTQVFVAELPEGQTAVHHEGEAMKWCTLEEVRALIAAGEFGFGQEAFFDRLTAYVHDNS